MMETKRCAAGTLLLLLMLSFPCAAQAKPQPTPATERPRLPPQIEQVFELAMRVPPEFAASALLRVESKVPEKELRRNLIDLAFSLAAKARNPVRLESVPGLSPDTRTGFLASALKLKLDAMSLQSRAVVSMLEFDPAHSRDLFMQMVRPPTGDAGCEDSLLPDVSSFYDTLATVIRRGFSVKERAEEQHVDFLVAVLNRSSGVRELEPVLKTSAALDWSRTESELLIGPLISKFSTTPTDPRSFMATAARIDSAMGQFVSKLRSLKTSPEGLVSAYRDFLVRQYRAPRCTDGEPQPQVAKDGQAREIFGPDIRGELTELGGEETTPQWLEGEMKVERFWQSATSQEILQDCLKLSRSSEAARRGPEWSRQVTDLLARLAAWKPIGEPSNAEYFHQKATLFETLLELAPPGDLNDRVLENFMGLLKSSSMQQQDPVEWFWQARTAIERVRPGHPELDGKIRTAYRGSGSIILMLESMVEKVAPENAYLEPAGQRD